MLVSWLLAQLGLPFPEPAAPAPRNSKRATGRRRRQRRRQRPQRPRRPQRPEEIEAAARQLAADRKHRELLKSVVPGLFARWEPRLGVEAREWRLKQMRTRWGSCNVEARRIWLNVELAKHTPDCLEYVVVHELVHLLEPSHNHRFQSLMTEHLPDWRERRTRLNSGAGRRRQSAETASANQDALELC